VTKPASRNSSPRNLSRRKTTASVPGPNRNRSAPDSQQHDYTRWPYPYAIDRERPISWHPTSLDQYPEYPYCGYQNPTSTADFSGTPFTTTEVNGLITPMSLPLPNEPQIQEIITPLEESSLQDYEQQYACLNQLNTKSNNPYMMFNNDGPMFPSEFLPHGHYSWLQPPPYGDHQQSSSFLIPRVETAPASPDLLPIQSFNDTDNLNMAPLALSTSTLNLSTSTSNSNSGQEELVGMGLYDSPVDVQSSTSWFRNGTGRQVSMAGGRPSLGKGLKLEESFEPLSLGVEDGDGDGDGDDTGHEEEDDDDDDDDNDNDDCDYGGLTSLSNSTNNSNYSYNHNLNIMPRIPTRAAAATTTNAAPNLANHSFFFEHEHDDLGSSGYGLNLNSNSSAPTASTSNADYTNMNTNYGWTSSSATSSAGNNNNHSYYGWI